MKPHPFLILAASLAAAGAPAASSSSATYAIPADTIDAGGRRSTNAGFVVDASIGGIGGISSVAAPAGMVRHGYIGQLYEPATLIVTANPTNVNEGGTRQLEALVVNNDATTSFPAASQVGWSVVSGPLVSIQASGLAAADVVYQNEPAVVRGTFGGLAGQLGLTVLNTNPDNFGLYAGDSLDDAWQVRYFGVGNVNGLPGADPDGDGQVNRFEYIADTVPTNALSKFNLTIAPVAGEPNRKDLIFSPRFPTRTYAVHQAATANSPVLVPLAGAITTDLGPTRTVRDVTATNDARFYRVFITFP